MRLTLLVLPAVASLGLATETAGESFDCVIVPAVTVSVGSPVSGLLEKVLVDHGDLVKAGQKIAMLRSEVERKTVELLAVEAESQAEIEAQASRLALAEKRLARVRDLLERQVAPRERMEAAEAEVEVIRREKSIAEMRRQIAALELDRARAQLEQRSIYSPIDGVVVARHMFDGEFLYAEADVVSIAQIDPLHVEAYLPVSHFGRIEVGETLAVFPDKPLQGSFSATVDVVDRVFDAASGTFGLRLSLPNPSLEIPAGHRCTLKILDIGN